MARAVLEGGETKTKSVKEISETSKVIKEKMDQELKFVIDSFKLKAEFFVQSPPLKKLWRRFFSDQYRVPLDLFSQAFACQFDASLLS